jgi:glycosyltransferase involved in cell wall biosynthesis
VRVAFDVTALLNGDTGVARYVRELGAATEHLDVDLARFAIGRGEHRDQLPPGTRTTRLPLRVVHRSWALSGPPSAERMARGCDVVHTPDLVPPPTRRPVVLTVHDLVAMERPDLHPERSVDEQQRQLRAARERASVVVCVSQATADSVIDHGVDRDRVVVVPNGVTALPEPNPSAAPERPFLLAVGSLTPRKGLETLVAAFAHADLPDDLVLVLAGPDGWAADRVREAVRRAAPPGRVRLAGRVTDAQLAALYERCVAVCVPSVAEGFGLPVLEAAAAGAPVVASDIPVFRELQDAVAAFAPPGDIDAWAGALERVVGDPESRARGASRARATADDHTWARTAELTVAAYARALESA